MLVLIRLAAMTIGACTHPWTRPKALFSGANDPAVQREYKRQRHGQTVAQITQHSVPLVVAKDILSLFAPKNRLT